MTLEWDKSLETGVASIDAEHKHLIELIKLMSIASNSQAMFRIPNETIITIVNRLLATTRG